MLEKMSSVPLLENGSLGTRAGLFPPFHAPFHPRLSNVPLFLSFTAEAILRINTQTEPASQAC